MCRYQDAAAAVALAASRAEYTAIQSSRLAGGIDDPNSQVVNEATALIDEWVAVRQGLGTAEEVLTLAAQHPEAFEEFRRVVTAPAPLSTARRDIARPPVPKRAPGRTIASILGAVRGR